MAKLIPLFNGGNYKRGQDDGRERLLLTDCEAQNVQWDPDLPSNNDNAIFTELAMAKYADALQGLAVDDQILVGLVPDAMTVRGIYMGSYDAVPGFKVKYDLVSVKDIADAITAGNDPTLVPGFGVAADNIAYDFTDGLGHATKDAESYGNLYSVAPSTLRNPAALKFKNMVPRLVTLHEPLYMRLTVVAVGDLYTSGTDSCCGSCDGATMPTFVTGALGDQLPFNKQRVRDFCNCNESGCAGCN